MNQAKIYIFIATIFLISCRTTKQQMIYTSANVQVEQLTRHTFRHVSFLELEKGGKVACNGMIVIDQGEAIVFDTPTTDADSRELISIIENVLNSKVVGVVATHFHKDCLGGLKEFHSREIPSYANEKTKELAAKNSAEVPQQGFVNTLQLSVGKSIVMNEFLGEGHTADNIVSYFPDDEVLFGGCLIKGLRAGKGFLGDANTGEWSSTVRKVKSKYGKAEIIIPGHGKPGNAKLLDYTIEMFENI